MLWPNPTKPVARMKDEVHLFSLISNAHITYEMNKAVRLSTFLCATIGPQPIGGFYPTYPTSDPMK